MLFNSLPFFLLVTFAFVLFYFQANGRAQTAVLITASLIFYGYGQPYLLILLITSASINALTSYRVYFATSNQQRFYWAFAGVATNLLVLAFFKYNRLLATSFWRDGVSGVGELLLTVPLPIGISFYTFQGISLLVDAYRNFSEKRLSPITLDEKFSSHFSKTFFFIVFFPQLVAGPIVKAHDFFPQIAQKFFKDIHWNTVVRSLIMGFFLKSVIADNLKDQTFWIAYPYFESSASLTLIALLLGYSAQIFADFAGYSLIAIGVAALFGYVLPQNFNFPYISQSIAEFWRRWHISLSSWLKEYLYIPLGGNRKGAVRTYINLMITMILGGLWHGAAWSYAVWGAWHGVGLAVERALGFDKGGRGIIAVLRMLLVFSFVTLGWLLFKLPDFSQAVKYMVIMFKFNTFSFDILRVLITLIYVMPVALWHINYLLSQNERFARFGKRFAYIPYALMLFLISVNSGSQGEFIYFQF